MPVNSPFQIDIPGTDILTYLFGKGDEKDVSDKPIWVDAEDTENALSPRALLGWVRRLGMGLHKLGVQRQDVVMMYSTNHIFVPVAYLGVAGAGGIFSGCNPAYGVDETTYQIENTGCKTILVEPALLPTLLKAATSANFPKDRIFLFSDKETGTINGIHDWRTFLPSDEEASSWHWQTLNPAQSRTTIAALNYSSGTTGLPKGVMISHQNIIANVSQSIYMRDLSQPYTASQSNPNPSPRPEERWLGFLPLYHAYGQLWSIVSAAKTLSPCFFMRSFSYPNFLSHIQNHRITHIQTAPPVLVMLAKRPETSSYDLSSLQNILCGAAPLSKELQNEVSSKLDLKVVQTWGMTEVTCSCLHVPGGVDDRSGSVGFIDPNAQIKLIDDEGKEVGVGERGEIHVQGPNVCLGYWRNEAATEDTFDEEGYLKTGDIAVRDEQGWFWIVDRKKELIKVKGFQVAPAELEALLLSHESISDAAVCAVLLEHEERPRAYVAVKEEWKEKVEERQIEEWVRERVAKHKWLTGGVVFVDEVPKSPSGKIQRKVLREWAKSDQEGGRSGVGAKL